MYQKGQIVDCEVTGVVPYGVFVKVGNCTGLIHISEISDKYVRDIQTFACVGDIIKAQIIDCEEGVNQLKLSYKKCQRAKRIIVAKPEIGFKSLEESLPQWVKQKGYNSDEVK